MKGMSIAFRRREVKALNVLTEWIKGKRKLRHIVLLLSLLAGVGASLAAFVLKTLVEEIKNLLTPGEVLT